jgi:hypothetical protein
MFTSAISLLGAITEVERQGLRFVNKKRSAGLYESGLPEELLELLLQVLHQNPLLPRLVLVSNICGTSASFLKL